MLVNRSSLDLLTLLKGSIQLDVLAKIGAIHVLSPLLLLLAQTFHNFAVGPPDGFGVKETVHSLKRNTLCLGHEEEHEEDRKDHKRGEEVVDTVS